jgi:hypothetical protein
MCKRCRKYGVDANGLFVKYCRLCQKWYDGEINFTEKKKKVNDTCKREVSFSGSEDEKNNEDETPSPDDKDFSHLTLLEKSNLSTYGIEGLESYDSDEISNEGYEIWFDVEVKPGFDH